MVVTPAKVWIPYCGAAPAPSELLARWNLDPLLIGALLVAGAVYWRATAPAANRHRFLAAWLLMVLLFVSPLCALSSALFSVRVVHHAVLVAVIAPLLVGAVPRDQIRLPGSLPLWTGIHAAVLWCWHAPPVYAAALSGNALFWTMQLSLLGSAFAFWAAARRASEPAAVAMLLITMMQMGLLGALITFAGAPLYAPHLLGTLAWGYSPLEDQQLAGIIMWAPTSALYLGAALFLMSRWLKRTEQPAAAEC